MAENTKQLRWIVALYGNLAALFRDAPEVFVGGNQFWYPVEGHPEIRMAPDVYVVFGRPKGDRPSYMHWQEGDVPMTVVFEVLSPGNTHPEMIDKHAFYEEYGAEEYYIFDPDENRLFVYVRQGEMLRRERQVAGFVSPRLGIRFDLPGPELVVYRPDGEPFLSFEELEEARAQERQQRLAAEEQTAREQQRLAAEQRATQAEQHATQAEQRAARVADLSRKARRQQATAEELAELDRLEQQDGSAP
jgi:Uma2 family endonuclease